MLSPTYMLTQHIHESKHMGSFPDTLFCSIHLYICPWALSHHVNHCSSVMRTDGQGSVNLPKHKFRTRESDKDLLIT